MSEEIMWLMGAVGLGVFAFGVWLGAALQRRDSKCKHKNTHFKEVEGVDIQFCEDCGMSRDVDYPAPSEWVMVDIDKIRQERKTQFKKWEQKDGTSKTKRTVDEADPRGTRTY